MSVKKGEKFGSWEEIQDSRTEHDGGKRKNERNKPLRVVATDVMIKIALLKIENEVQFQEAIEALPKSTRADVLRYIASQEAIV